RHIAWARRSIVIKRIRSRAEFTQRHPGQRGFSIVCVGYVNDLGQATSASPASRLRGSGISTRPARNTNGIGLSEQIEIGILIEVQVDLASALIDDRYILLQIGTSRTDTVARQ